MDKVIPLGLRTTLESGNAVLFVGAGIGHNSIGKNGVSAPDGRELAVELITKFGIAPPSHIELAQIAKIVEIRHGRSELEAYVAKRLAGLEPDENLQWLCSLRWRAIFTTNYDALIERSFEILSKPEHIAVSISITADLAYTGTPFDIPIYHLHGSIFSSPGSIVITDDDYANFRARRSMLFETLKRELASSQIVYVGYSNSDPNWNMVLSEMKAEFSPASPPHAYRLAPSTEPLAKEILASKGIETIDMDLSEMALLAAPILEQPRRDTVTFRAMAARVPSQLVELFNIYPAPVARLIKSWEYVNQAGFDGAENLRAFLAGDLPSWSLAAGHVPFERDAEEELYEDLLDYATSAKPRVTTLVLLGSAGFGVSTLLMVLAAKLIEQDAGRVFFHRRGAPLLEGDVVFAAGQFRERCFLFVDNAADEVASISSLVERLKELRLPVCLVLGERINEWRQGKTNFRGKEHILGDLSDAEIDRLLNFLAANHALGKLGDLDRRLQFAAISERHGKQLLVTMREATENAPSFDAIIEDEYHSLSSEIARNLYAAVSCFYHLRCYARDELVAKVVGVSLEELYRQTSHATEGVILWDCVDDDRGVYAARTRHHIIASIIWSRCLSGSERDSFLLRAIGYLNLNFYIDKRAFDAFVRNDNQVSSISTFEGRVEFFEIAARKDPDSPYIFQHYARMLLREGKLELSLSQIDKAIEMNSGLRVLHHTRGRVLAALALGTESEGIARKRLAQSEAAFTKSKRLGERDPYPYQGLAELYFGWAKRATSDEEMVKYISQAESVVGEGLGRARDREGLWIISAQIHGWLGNRPGFVANLAKAIESDPTSSVARYLLGRFLRNAGRLTEAIDVLRPAVEGSPDNVRVLVEYARALIDSGEDYPKALAVLRLGEISGRSDPRFLSYWGGILFLEGKFTEAKRVFLIARESAFAAAEARRTQFFPRDILGSAKPLRFEGEVVAVKPGFVFVRSPGYPDFFLSGSKFGDWVVEVGQKVSFQVAFASLGPVALEPTLIG